MLRDPGLGAVTTVGLKSREEETILLEPNWELDPGEKGKLTKATTVEVATTIKTSLQQEGGQRNKDLIIFLFSLSDLLPGFPLTNPGGSQRARKLGDTIHRRQHLREGARAQKCGE